jgi:hypothetical protein
VLELEGLFTHVALGMSICRMMAWVVLPNGAAVDFVPSMVVVVGGLRGWERGWEPTPGANLSQHDHWCDEVDELSSDYC